MLYIKHILIERIRTEEFQKSPKKGRYGGKTKTVQESETSSAYIVIFPLHGMQVSKAEKLFRSLGRGGRLSCCVAMFGTCKTQGSG